MFFLQALDALGSTKWKINHVVLDVLERMWKEGGRLADLEDGDDVSFCLEVNHNWGGQIQDFISILNVKLLSLCSYCSYLTATFV